MPVFTYKLRDTDTGQVEVLRVFAQNDAHGKLEAQRIAKRKKELRKVYQVMFPVQSPASGN